MATADFSDVRGLKAFNPAGDANQVSLKWKAWLEEFEAYADSKGLIINEAENTTRHRGEHYCCTLQEQR